MNLINKDFVSAKERVNNFFPIKKNSPFHLAKIYFAAEREALNQFGLRQNEVPVKLLESKVINVLCRWVSDKIDNSIILGNNNE